MDTPSRQQDESNANANANGNGIGSSLQFISTTDLELALKLEEKAIADDLAILEASFAIQSLSYSPKFWRVFIEGPHRERIPVDCELSAVWIIQFCRREMKRIAKIRRKYSKRRAALLKSVIDQIKVDANQSGQIPPTQVLKVKNP